MDDRRLTVVQLVPALESGGVERGVLEVAAELVARGHRSLVISAGGRMVDRLIAAGSEHIAWTIGGKSPWTFRYVPLLRSLLRDERVDVLHARSRVPAWVGWLTWKSMPPAARPKFITTVHGQYSVGRYSSVMMRGEAVIAVSKTIRDYILLHYPHTDPSRVHLIPRGRDPREFPHGRRPDAAWRAAWRLEHPQTHGKTLITLPGRITRLKGHSEFIELIADLRAAGLDVHGLIVGDQDPRRREYAAELRRSVAACGFDEHITFTGHRRDIREVYGLSSIVCSLSRTPESFGRTTLEALSLGVPVVGYDHGGVGELLHELFPAGAVPPGQREALRARVQELLETGPHVVPPFTSYALQDVLDRELAIYQELAGLREQAA